MLTKDIVCEMQVESGNLEIDYLGVSYSFCSVQCQERFQANPHLYVGMPGKQAPKQQGLSVIKQRRLRLAEPLSAGEADEVKATLQSMMGIESITFETDCMLIAYDLLQASAEQIEEKLATTGIKLGRGLGERLRRAFVHYEEDCEVGNLEVHKNKHAHRH